MKKYHKIEEILDEKGITKRWLAKKVERSEQAISSICKGKSNPPLPLLFDIAKVLEVSPCELLNTSDVNQDYIKKMIENVIAQLNSRKESPSFLASLERLLLDLKKEKE